jgi:hypothetical protein
MSSDTQSKPACPMISTNAGLPEKHCIPSNGPGFANFFRKSMLKRCFSSGALLLG